MGGGEKKNFYYPHILFVEDGRMFLHVLWGWVSEDNVYYFGYVFSVNTEAPVVGLHVISSQTPEFSLWLKLKLLTEATE